MYNILILFLVLCSSVAAGQEGFENEKQKILAVMEQQEKHWNEGDIEGFMQGYWPSDSLKFIGSKGLTYGWQQTLDNYKDSYPDKAAMGKLSFEVIFVEQLAEDAALVIGKWKLERTGNDLGGYYSLIWKKIKGEWVIVADHSS